MTITKSRYERDNRLVFTKTYNTVVMQLTAEAYFCNAFSLATVKVHVSPVTALVVVGRLSRSSFTAVTPIPYSVPGLSPALTNNMTTLTYQNET